jgi:DNA-binding transcriptional LysR family regulator
MDIELAGTFLEIVSTGSFVRASERLNVGQTTVSARMRLLEQQLGRSLFVRYKSGAALAPTGERFFAVCADVRATVAAGASPSDVAAWSRCRVDHRQRGYVIATVLARLGAMDAAIAS